MSCGKRTHRNKTAAIAAAIRLSRNNVPLRTYYCHKCRGHHLTSKPKWSVTDGATA